MYSRSTKNSACEDTCSFQHTDVEEASVKEANVEEVDVATDEFDRDDESEALSSENSGGKKRDRDGDALYHSTSKWRLIDPEFVSAEEALSSFHPSLSFHQVLRYQSQ
ncbi:hypothetical protein C2G38_616959 [Gigaspora rosea]|uniref:Uncharacterized protein n=1 Tax=Gigaspora rosea TaxID=44941 RepID=A0A397U4Q8_9GLOM|nr:hypothetical protein C2G38_616959 [Gigaspora rosea]